MFGRCLILLTAAVAFAGCSAPRKPVPESQASGLLATCTVCHGDPANGNAAPPRSVKGATESSDIAVGAHQVHLTPSLIRQPLACSECHVVPASVDANGHTYVLQDPANPNSPKLGIDRAILTWGPLASANGVTPSPAGGQIAPEGAITCTNYCHGATLGGGALKTPQWNVVNGTQAGCGTCHGIPPPPPHPAATNITQCAGCHPNTVNPDGTINVGGGRHINGILDLAGGGGCTGCHGDPNRTPADIAAAPPRDTTGHTDPSAPGVGAHQAHLTAGPVRAALPCASCHVVPTDLAHATQPLNLTWSPLAQTGGFSPTFNATTLTCTNYCHGSSLGAGGSNTSPVWTGGPGQAACGTCHAIPPPASSGHPAVGSDPTVCGQCHPGTVKADGTIDTAGGKHVNGTVDVTGGTCTSCHGDPNRANAAIAPAPPKDTKGNTATTAPGVGAHQAHLNAGILAPALACSECHIVPTDASHAVQPLNLTWGPLAQSNGVAPTFDATALTCTNYCHGATLQGGVDTTPVWNGGTGQAACGTCHGLPPPTGQHGIAPHAGLSCIVCHGSGYTASTTNTAAHINGVKDVGLAGSSIQTWVPPSGSTPGSCTPSCHGTRSW